jgi:ubiquinone/menaquinone biosynthesis C-methylase UbiE
LEGGISEDMIQQYFSEVANRYNKLRVTDLEPIGYIAEKIKKLEQIEAIDIGCGSVRYDALFYKFLGSKLKLTCADSNFEMLDSLIKYFSSQNISRYTTINAPAENTMYKDKVFDCVFTFNAVHHFNLLEFLRESARILKTGGNLFVYTRLPDQNRRNIWGQHFPMFNQKETRLYSLNKFVKTVRLVPQLRLKSIEYYRYERKSALQELVQRTRAHHYSTFVLYSLEELEKAIIGFISNIKNNFKDEANIHWVDENVMFVISKM